MVSLQTRRMKVKNTMRLMMVYGSSVLIASLVYWSIGYLLFASAPF
ncbi:hypothetical protein [Kaarinaea lacus]